MQRGRSQSGDDHHDGDRAPYDHVAIVPFDDNDTPQDIGTNAAASASPARQSTRAGDATRSRSRRPVVLGIAAVIVAGAVVAALVIAGDDSLTASPEPAFDDLAGEQAGGEGNPNGLKPDDSFVDHSGTANFPPGDVHRAGDVTADLFGLRVDGASKYAVIYPTVTGLQMLSSDGATSPKLEVAVGFEEAVRFPLVNDGGRTWAINPADRETAYVVSTQFVVVDVGLEGSVAFINPSVTPTNVGISSFGAWGPGFDVPVDSEILAIPGRGLLIVPPTGGTFRLAIGGVEKISDDRVVAAGLQSEVYQRCDDDLECELYVTGVGNTDGFPLDLDPGEPVYVSPDGGFALAADREGNAQITTLASAEEWDVIEGAISSAGWAPDESFVAFVAGNDLVLAFPDERRIEAVTIPTVPSSRNMLVVASPR